MKKNYFVALSSSFLFAKLYRVIIRALLLLNII